METFFKVENKETLLRDIEKLIDKKLTQFQTKTEDPLLTRADTAKLLQKSLTWVDNMRRDGNLKALSLGGSVYFRMSEINRALEDGAIR